ncbi:MAG: hypothetical protein ACKV2V_28360 [Blastocatellia bacterium]
MVFRHSGKSRETTVPARGHLAREMREMMDAVTTSSSSRRLC